MKALATLLLLFTGYLAQAACAVINSNKGKSIPRKEYAVLDDTSVLDRNVFGVESLNERRFGLILDDELELEQERARELESSVYKRINETKFDASRLENSSSHSETEFPMRNNASDYEGDCCVRLLDYAENYILFSALFFLNTQRNLRTFWNTF